jgi:hypothetical protein
VCARNDPQLLATCGVVRAKLVAAAIRSFRTGNSDGLIARVAGLAHRFVQVLAVMPVSLDTYSTSLRVSAGVREITETGLNSGNTERFIEELLCAVDSLVAEVGGPPAEAEPLQAARAAAGIDSGADGDMSDDDDASYASEGWWSDESDDESDGEPPELTQCSDSDDDSSDPDDSGELHAGQGDGEPGCINGTLPGRRDAGQAAAPGNGAN